MQSFLTSPVAEWDSGRHGVSSIAAGKLISEHGKLVGVATRSELAKGLDSTSATCFVRLWHHRKSRRACSTRFSHSNPFACRITIIHNHVFEYEGLEDAVIHWNGWLEIETRRTDMILTMPIDSTWILCNMYPLRTENRLFNCSTHHDHLSKLS